MEIIPQLGLVIILVFLNGFFVASEFALVAVRKTRIDELVKKGNRTARLVQNSIERLDTFISATQLGITLASLALGWIGEPAIASFIEPWFENFLPENISLVSSHGLAIAIAFSFITFLHIVLGELAPKTIALQKAEFVSLLIIAPLTFFTNIFRPFIFVLNGAGNIVLKLVGFKAPSGHQLVHSEEEIKIILAQSAEKGAIEKEEAEMVYSVLRLGDIPVKQIMIPKSRIIAFEKETSIENIIKTTLKKPHSRFPVYEKNIENIVGFVHIKDIYKNIVLHNTFDSLKDFYRSFLRKRSDGSLRSLKNIRKIPHIPKTMRIDDVLVKLKKRRTHIAVVDDEKGKSAGIVTLEDIIESLVGDIHDEFEDLDKRKANLLKKVITK